MKISTSMVNTVYFINFIYFFINFQFAISLMKTQLPDYHQCHVPFSKGGNFWIRFTVNARLLVS